MVYSVAHILAALNSGGIDAFKAAKFLRTRAETDQQVEVLGKLPNDHPNFEKYLVGPCFPKSYADIWATSTPPEISNSHRAINWFIALAPRFSDQLKTHIRLRSQLIRSMMHGDWINADQILKQHQTQFGPSLWAMQWGILLAEDSRGSQHRAELVALFSKKEHGAASGAFAYLYGLSADKLHSEDVFQIQVRTCIKNSNKPLYQFLEHVFFGESTEPWKSSDMLAFCERLPFIDRYEFFIRLALCSVGTAHPDGQRIKNAISTLSKSYNDEHLLYLAECLNADSELGCNSQVSNIMPAWDAYMIGNYRLCKTISSAAIQSNPGYFPPHELYVKSLMYLKEQQSINSDSSTSASLHKHLHAFYSKNDQSDDALNYLVRLGSRYPIFTLTPTLRALYSQHLTPHSDARWLKMSSYSLGVHGPRNFEYGHDVSTNHKYLTRLKRGFPNQISVDFFCSLVSGNQNDGATAFEAIPLIRKQFFRGIAAAKQNNTSMAENALSEFLLLQAKDSNNPLSPFAIEEARRALVGVHLLKGSFKDILEIIVYSYIERPQSVRRLPIQRIYQACKEKWREVCSFIGFPIISYLACDDPHEVSMDLRRFLHANAAQTPRQLPIQTSAFPNGAIEILFLKVCTPEVLDSLDELNTVEKVDQERLTLLHLVANKSQSLGNAARNEILKLTQHIQLRDALHQIEGARIVVNVTALREAEHEIFSDSFLRFHSQRNMATTIATKETFSKISEVIRANPDVDTIIIDASLLENQNIAIRKAFIDAFRKVRDVYLSSPHFGLEACLSSRIRHGVVIQHIRSPYVLKKLIITKTAISQNDSVDYWRAKLFNGNPSETMKPISGILLSFTNEINKIAEEVKDVWLQCRTEERNPNALFDFAFNDDQLDNLLQERFGEADSLEVFLDLSFEILLERTRQGINVVRNRIDNVLKEVLLASVNSAVKGLTNIQNETAYQPLKSNLIACLSETERACEQMKQWFQETDANLMGDVACDLVARTAIGMIEQLNPDYKGLNVCEVDNELRIKGRHVTALVHILFHMLDNAIRHSGVDKDNLTTCVVIRCDKSYLFLGVRNNISSPERAKQAETTIRVTVDKLLANLDPEQVVKEGGTGFAKLIAAVRYEFKQRQPEFIIKANEASIEVNVKCARSGLVV